MALRKSILLSMAAISGLLGGCGGGGGGTAPVITPPPPQPTPEPPPQSIHFLQRNETFSAAGITASVTVDKNSGHASGGSISPASFTISYDAASESYTITKPGHSSTFSRSDTRSSSRDTFAIYKKDGASSNEQLILLRTFLENGAANTQYVAVGMWQRNTVHANTTDTLFETFVYGFETPVTAVPRTGVASYWLDVFGLTTAPGMEPKYIGGHAVLGVDFAAGVFSLSATPYGLNFPTNRVNGDDPFDLQSVGKLSSTDGTLSGPVSFNGATGQMYGTLSGRFYGPDAKEVGATFSATNENGSTVTGGFSGSGSPNYPDRSLTLTNPGPYLNARLDSAVMFLNPAINNQGIEEGFSANLFRFNNGTIHSSANGTVNVTPGGGYHSVGSIEPEFIVETNNPNFTVYEKTVDGQKDRVSLHKPGPQNTQLNLTYSNFGQWQTASEDESFDDNRMRAFFAYGVQTPDWALSARTGSARYSGIVYAAGANRETLTHYAVTGTSHFNVDFSDKNYSGNLILFGTPANGGSRIDFGNYNFDGKLGSSNSLTANLRQSGSEHGHIQARFYGPTAEEIAGSFTLTVAPGNPGAGTAIAGATAARKN